MATVGRLGVLGGLNDEMYDQGYDEYDQEYAEEDAQVWMFPSRPTCDRCSPLCVHESVRWPWARANPYRAVSKAEAWRGGLYTLPHRHRDA